MTQLSQVARLYELIFYWKINIGIKNEFSVCKMDYKGKKLVNYTVKKVVKKKNLIHSTSAG